MGHPPMWPRCAPEGLDGGEHLGQGSGCRACGGREGGPWSRHRVPRALGESGAHVLEDTGLVHVATLSFVFCSALTWRLVLKKLFFSEVVF